MPGILSKIAGGANRIADELINPTSALGKLGAYVGAASGGVLGQAALANMRDQRSQGDDELNRQYKQAQIQKLLSPETFSPRYFESNSGDQYMIGQDGQPKLVFKDPTPKTEWQWIKNPDGTMSGIPMPIGGIPQAAPSQQRPPEFLPPDFDFGGGSGNATGGFRR